MFHPVFLSLLFTAGIATLALLLNHEATVAVAALTSMTTVAVAAIAAARVASPATEATPT